MFLGDTPITVEGNPLPEQPRFIQPAWPRRRRTSFGVLGGSGGVRIPQPDLSGSLKILSIATEWSSSNGGLSTINRELCIALARSGHDVVCLVPAGAADYADHNRASQARVQLVEAQTTTGKYGGTPADLQRKPRLPSGFIPDVVIGHGRVTGPFAQVFVQDYFTSALLVQVVHTQPGELEWHKPRETSPSERIEKNEMEESVLAATASLVVGVGPRLRRQADMYLHPLNDKRPTFELIPGITNAAEIKGPAPEIECLFVGRAEDERPKGLDIAAAAVKYARAYGQSVRLVVRGAEPDSDSELQARLTELIGAPNSVKVYLFNPSKDVILPSYLRASVVLMPSRTEGFGLVGLEAIELGVPTLISDQSGLAELLRRDLPGLAADVVVPITHDDETNYQTWGSRLLNVLTDRSGGSGACGRVAKRIFKEALMVCRGRRFGRRPPQTFIRGE